MSDTSTEVAAVGKLVMDVLNKTHPATAVMGSLDHGVWTFRLNVHMPATEVSLTPDRRARAFRVEISDIS